MASCQAKKTEKADAGPLSLRDLDPARPLSVGKSPRNTRAARAPAIQ